MEHRTVQAEDVIVELQKRIGTIVSNYEYQMSLMALSHREDLALRDEKILELQNLLDMLSMKEEGQ